MGLVVAPTRPVHAQGDGFVTGEVMQRNTLTKVLPFGEVNLSPGGTTDLGGGFAAGATTALLTGPHFSLNDLCTAPDATVGVDGSIDLGTGSGSDCAYSAVGHTTLAGRTSMYYLEKAHQLASEWPISASADSWLATDITVTTNVNSTCNGYYSSGTITLFVSGGGCRNAGEVYDVPVHEFGLGLDQNTHSGGDKARQFAFSDVFTTLISHDPCIAPGFLPAGTGETTACSRGVRDLRRTVTTSNIGAFCNTVTPGSGGALGYDPHCESHLLSGALWDLANSLVSTYTTDEGWQVFEQLYFSALAPTVNDQPGDPNNAYDAYLVADDDNGDVTDGTPHATLIYNAFNAHGIAGVERPTHAVACPTLASGPSVAHNRSAGGVGLSWTNQPGATYDVLRDDPADDVLAYLPVATGVTAPFVDTQTRPASAYTYYVVRHLAGCRSKLNNKTSVEAVGPDANQQPTATDQSLGTTRAKARSITLGGVDPEDGPLYSSVLSQPAHGTLTGTPPYLVYTPATPYVGADGFDFEVIDDHQQFAVGHVSLTVSKDPTAPTVAKPALTLETGHQLTTTAVPVTVRWSGADNLDPVTQLAFEIGESRATSAAGLLSFGVVRSFATGLVATHNDSPAWVQFRARARDVDGNVSGYAAGYRQKVGYYDEASTAWKYYGTWTRLARTGAVGGYVRTTTSTGAYAVATVAQRSVGVVLPRRSDLGTVRVCLDKGTSAQSCNDIVLTSSTSTPRLLLWSRNGLSSASHTVTIIRLSGRVDLDAIAVISQPG